jgi:hypothetical protein
MWVNERKNKGGEHQELQDLDPNRFPHLEEIMIGEDARMMGGMGRQQALRRSTMEGKHKLKR